MNVENYKKDPYENSDYKPELEKQISHPNETTIEFVDIRKPPEFNLFTYTKKMLGVFFKSFGFKIIFQLARKLDKTNKSSPFDLDKLFEVLLSPSNVKYGMFMVFIKLFFKLFRFLLYLVKMQDVIEYKRINFLLGLLVNFILIPIGRKSSLTFYTCIFYLIKSLIFFFRNYVYGVEKRVYSKSKQLYFIGMSLGFILIVILSPEYRNEIKLVKYFVD
jgi:hypothetical protein